MPDTNLNFTKPERGSGNNPDHIFLSFSGDSHHQMSVTWRTDAAIKDGYMLLRDGRGNETKIGAVSRPVRSDIDRSTIHTATAKGLESGSSYRYTVGNDEYRSEEFGFDTQEENCKDFSFLIISDHQKGSPTHLPDYSRVGSMLKKALEEHPECKFILTAGDNCDNGQNDLQWNGMFTGLKGIIESIPYMMTTGNHDNRGFVTYFPEPTGKFYLDHADYFDEQFMLSYPQNGPEGFKTENYSFDYGNAHFSILGINAPEKVADWAEKDISESDKTWKFGTYHFPIYPVMPEGQNDDGYPWLRKAVEKFDVIFEGHEHSFARTYPIRGDEMFDRPSMGTVHYIAGNGGGNIYHSNAQKVWHSAFWPQEERKGIYCIAHVSENLLTITAYVEDGRICDRFTIDKDSDTITPYALAPVYDIPKMTFKGRMLELIARGHGPVERDGILYAPFGVLIQAIGGKVIKETGTVYVEAYGHHALFREGDDKAETDMGIKKMSGKVFRERNQLYIPVSESAEIFGMSWYFARHNGYLNWNTPSEDKPLSPQP